MHSLHELWANTDSQDSPRLGLGRNHHLPLYSILYAWPRGQHPNVILSWDFQVRSFKIFEIGTPATLEAHTFLCRLSIKMRFKAKL